MVIKIKANISDILAVVASNSNDIVDVVNRIGLANIIKSGPAIYRIMKSIADRNESIEDAERILNYSVETRERVMAFQTKHGLEADGIVGNRTWRKVEELLGKS